MNGLILNLAAWLKNYSAYTGLNFFLMFVRA